MNNKLKFTIVFLAVALYTVFFVCVCKDKPTTVLYNEDEGFYISKLLDDKLEIQYDTVYVCDEWRQDSLILMYNIFDTKTNMHAADNVIRYGVHGYDNEELLIECAMRDKKYYQHILDSLQQRETEILKDPRRFDTDISYIKITGAIIRKRTS